MASNKQGIALSVKFNQNQVDRARVELAGITNGLKKALSGAINKVLAKGKTEVVRGLSEVLTAKPSAIRKMPSGNERISIVKSSPNKLEGFIKILTRRIGLINFKFKEVRKKRKRRKYGTSYPGEGVTAQVYKAGPTTRYKHSFVAVGAQGNKHIFLRPKPGGKVGTYAGQYPLERRQGPSLLTVYQKHPQLHDMVETRIRDELAKELDSQINRFLKRKK